MQTHYERKNVINKALHTEEAPNRDSHSCVVIKKKKTHST